MSITSILRFIIAGSMPVLFSAVFYRAKKKTKFGQLPYWVKQVIIAVCFGGLAILSTEFGIPVDGAVMNVRSASPLAAGLIF